MRCDDNGNGTDAGSVYVYNLDGTGQIKITASNGAASDTFGISVAVGMIKLLLVLGGY